ncbi:hypothetical protein L1787_22185 [Acuticoccus sp. M5D2P5]|uniref:hypothetical protein n=1 Tax=Acuticoccus kalidii TaxID=2910977 RepID=UPI001F207BE7|nr:hypothetical protein [Acuticoccus kalidii]MCF3936104.1 hypothetical protein [Acuticoccus kalidii]
MDFSGSFGDGPGPGGGTPTPFVAGYKPHQGDLMVYGGGVATLIGVLATVVQVNPVFLVISLMGTFSALYFWPTLDPRVPQLGADLRGIYVARVGIIRWEAIADMKVEWHALRTMQLSTLVLKVDGPLKDALAYREKVPLLHRVSAHNARVSGSTVKVTLHTLNMDPAVIEKRLVALRAAAKDA